MKRVGIITMHRVLNYGSVLQAFATQQIVRGLGFDAMLIDYKFPNQYHYDRETDERRKIKPWYKKTAKQNLINLVIKTKRLLGIGNQSIKIKRFKNFINDNYKLTEPYDTFERLNTMPPDFDIYMTGSDQVWNHKTSKGDPNFFLDFVRNGAPRIAFSASFTMIPDEASARYLKEYTHISMRENNGREICSRLTDRDIPLTLDPTLMLSADEWKRIAQAKQEDNGCIVLYMLDYAYGTNPYMYDIAKFWQKKIGTKIVSIGVCQSGTGLDIEKRDDSGPMEFIQIMYNARLVITNSFHGTAFALNFGKPLIAVAPPNDEDDRIATIITSTRTNNCLVKTGYAIDEIDPHYDVEAEQTTLDGLRRTSFDYLRNALNATK